MNPNSFAYSIEMAVHCLRDITYLTGGASR